MNDAADKIIKLLRKAESTDSPAEAETFMAKAQQLMTQYAIDQAMLEEREDGPKEEIVEASLNYTGTYRHALMKIGFRIAEANFCKAFYRAHNYDRPKRIEVVVCGYESDVERVKMLNASAQVQESAARAVWAKEHPTLSVMSRKEKRLGRRDFCFGFAEGLGQQLDAARKAGEKDAAEEAAKDGTSIEEASESVALVVRSRSDNVKDWYDEKWGRKLRTVNQNFSTSYTDGRSAGRSAGRTADVSTGGDRVGGSAPAGALSG